MSLRISASAALHGSGGSGAPTPGGSASLDTGGRARGGGSPAVGGPERSRRRGAGAAHGEKWAARRSSSGDAARARAARAMVASCSDKKSSLFCEREGTGRTHSLFKHRPATAR
jgi:hypothetical protein